MATHGRSHGGKIPIVEVVEARLRLERAQHLPARVVEQHHDRVEPVAPAIAKLPAGHLERAIADEDQGAVSSRGRNTKAGRYAETHAGIVGRGGERAVLD